MFRPGMLRKLFEGLTGKKPPETNRQARAAARKAPADTLFDVEELLTRPPPSYFTKRRTRGVMRNYHTWLGVLTPEQRKKALARLGR